MYQHDYPKVQSATTMFTAKWKNHMRGNVAQPTWADFAMQVPVLGSRCHGMGRVENTDNPPNPSQKSV